MEIPISELPQILGFNPPPEYNTIEKISAILPPYLQQQLIQLAQKHQSQKVGNEQHQSDPLQYIVISPVERAFQLAFSPEKRVLADYENAENKKENEILQQNPKVIPTVVTEQIVPTQTKEEGKMYCSCQQEKKEEMICCENELCTYQWFHYSCVHFTEELKQYYKDKDWFCSKECQLQYQQNKNKKKKK